MKDSEYSIKMSGDLVPAYGPNWLDVKAEVPCKTKENVRKIVCMSLLQDIYVCLCIYMCVVHVVCVHAPNYGCFVYV